MSDFSKKLLLALFSVFLVACDQAQLEDKSWFPLQEGAKWSYEVRHKLNSGKSWGSVLEMESLPAEQINGKWLSVRKSSSGNRYYIEKNEKGIVRRARQSIVDRYPRFDNQERYVIKYPAGNKKARWGYRTRPLLIKRSYPLGDLLLTNRLVLHTSWSYAGENETVETPLKTYEGCLHIQGVATSIIPRDLGLSRSEGVFRADEWYAKGVGLVKLEYSESVKKEPKLGGKITLTLLDYEP